MKQIRLDSFPIKGWHLYFVATTLNYFRVGTNITACPFSGQEDSDISIWFNFPWFEIGFGIENNEYSLWRK